VSQATVPAEALAAHSAMAIVLPAPGGPVTVVSGPRTPSVIRLSTRGRGTTQPGRVGTVILDVRIGSSAPFERAAPRALVTIPIRMVLFPLATVGGQPCARAADGMQGLDRPTALHSFSPASG
jgi:hypothetical protein